MVSKVSFPGARAKASFHASHGGNLETAHKGLTGAPSSPVPKKPTGAPKSSGAAKEIARLKKSAYHAIRKATKKMRSAKSPEEKVNAHKALEAGVAIVKHRLHLESLAKSSAKKKGAKNGLPKNGGKKGNPKKSAKTVFSKKGGKSGSPKKGSKQGAAHSGKAKAKKARGLPTAGAVGSAMKKDLHSMKKNIKQEKADRVHGAHDKARMKKDASRAKALKQSIQKKKRRAKALKRRALKRLKHAKTPAEKKAAKMDLRKAHKLMQEAESLEKQHAHLMKKAAMDHKQLVKEKQLAAGHKSKEHAAKHALGTAKKMSKHLEKKQKQAVKAASKSLEASEKKLSKATSAEIKLRTQWKEARKRGWSLLKKAKRLGRKAAKMSRKAQKKLQKAKTAAQRERAESMLRKAEKLAMKAARLKEKGSRTISKAKKFKARYHDQRKLVKKIKRKLPKIKRILKQAKRKLEQIKGIRATERGREHTEGDGEAEDGGKGKGKGKGQPSARQSKREKAAFGKSVQFGESNCRVGSMRLQRAMRQGRKTLKEAQRTEELSNKLIATEKKNAKKIDAIVEKVKEGTELLAKADTAKKKNKAKKRLVRAQKKLIKAKKRSKAEAKMRKKVEYHIEEIVEVAQAMINRMVKASMIMLDEARPFPAFQKMAQKFKKKVEKNKDYLAKRCATSRSIERRSRAAHAAIQQFDALAKNGNKLKKKILMEIKSAVPGR
eukprot:TRINITY_DN8720_c1_g2_i1.p1 TRINITY_DN8720_c1_g2~~TRINITY_DN8720_c1_g2_i1.p1  ORF type:complete len:828 (-),score=203.55 TRINITY_DN8720_c1_g2_i1:74-2230(-)